MYDIICKCVCSFLAFRFAGRWYNKLCGSWDRSFQKRFLKKLKRPQRHDKTELNTIRETRENEELELTFVMGKTDASDPYFGDSIGTF